MTIYAYDTIQYLDANDAPSGAGWYMVKANQSAAKKNAATLLKKAPDGDVPVIMNKAAEGQPKPSVMEGKPTIYQIEKDFGPKYMHMFQEAITEADDNSVLRFGEGVEIVSVKKGSVNLPNADGTKLKMKTSKMELKSEDGDAYFIYVRFAAEKFSYQTPNSDVMSLDAFHGLWKDGGTTFERIKGSKSNDEISGDEEANVIDGNGGIDMIYGRDGNDTITIQRGEAHGGDGNDTIYSENAKVYGGDGNDVIHMQNNISYGGDGNDTIYYHRGEVHGGDGNDVIQASTASAGSAAVLKGGAGDDTLSADGRDSTLTGGKGADVMHGGSGVDMLSYRGSDAGVYVNLTNGKAKGGDAQGDKFSGIENIWGSDHDDNLRGDSGSNRIFGGKGDDIIAGADGADLLNGGEGEDTLDYHYSSEGVRVDLSLQEDYVAYTGLGADAGGQASGDLIQGFENVRGSQHDDILTGSSDAYVRNEKTAEGDNKLYGGKGNDTLIGSGGSDLLDGGKGVDTVSYENAKSGVHVDLSTGQGSKGQAAGDSYVSIENLTGSDHDDVLAGNDGVNVINAGKGDDVVMAKADGDTITLGAGSDVVDFTAVDSLADISADIITDFTKGEDSIKLSQSLLGETGSITATVAENDGVTGLALSVTTMTGGVATSVNFAFLEGVSEISQSDFEGDFVPSIDVV